MCFVEDLAEACGNFEPFILFPTRVLFLRRSAPCGARHLWFVTRWWGPYFSSRSAPSEPLIFMTTGTRY